MSKECGLELSLVIPVYNEEGSLESVHNEICDALNGKYDYEVIYVDDGSSDNSFHILSRMCEKDKRVKVIKFRKNFSIVEDD